MQIFRACFLGLLLSIEFFLFCNKVLNGIWSKVRLRYNFWLWVFDFNSLWLVIPNLHFHKRDSFCDFSRIEMPWLCAILILLSQFYSIFLFQNIIEIPLLTSSQKLAFLICILLVRQASCEHPFLHRDKVATRPQLALIPDVVFFFFHLKMNKDIVLSSVSSSQSP